MKNTLKRKTGFVSAVLVLAILIAGTFAWSMQSSRAFNPTWEDGNHGCRFHDNWDGTVAGLRNWDVYTENFCTENIFVRVQLREFLSFDGVSVIPGVDVDDPDHWPLYLSEPNNVHERLAGSDIHTIAENYGLSWTLGDGNEERKMFMPTHNHARYRVDPARTFTTAPELFAHPEAFRMTEATGHAVDNIAYDIRNVAFDATAMTSAEDYHTIGYQTGPGDGTHDYWRDHATGVHYAPLIYTVIVGGDVELRVTGYDVPHTRQETLAPYIDLGTVDASSSLDPADFADGIMTIENWLELGQPAGNFWILDTTNDEGWFYWNGYLPPGEATSLLVDDVLIPNFGGSWDRWDYVTSMTGDCFTCESIDYLDIDPSSPIHDMLDCDEEEDEVPILTLYNRRLASAELDAGFEVAFKLGTDDEEGNVGNAMLSNGVMVKFNDIISRRRF